VQHETVVFKFGNSNGDPIFTQVAQTDETTAFILGVGHGVTTSMGGQPGTGIFWITGKSTNIIKCSVTCFPFLTSIIPVSRYPRTPTTGLQSRSGEW
jgi:hypothetical protein